MRYYLGYISFTRISDYKHHPSDVLAGVILGSSIGYLTLYAMMELPTSPRIFRRNASAPGDLSDADDDVLSSDVVDGRRARRRQDQVELGT